jgi:hypothetical protein
LQQRDTPCLQGLFVKRIARAIEKIALGKRRRIGSFESCGFGNEAPFGRTNMAALVSRCPRFSRAMRAHTRRVRAGVQPEPDMIYVYRAISIQYLATAPLHATHAGCSITGAKREEQR